MDNLLLGAIACFLLGTLNIPYCLQGSRFSFAALGFCCGQGAALALVGLIR